MAWWLTVSTLIALAFAAVVATTQLQRSAHAPWLIVDPAGPTVIEGQHGQITGSFRVTDPNGHRLHYEVTTTTARPTSGRFTIDEAAGTYTFVPTQAALLQAGDALASMEETFVVAVSDGIHNPVTVTVTVPVTREQLVVQDPPIVVGDRPIHVAVSPDGNRAYVLSPTGHGTLTEIDTATHTVTGNPIQLGQRFASRFAMSPDGRLLYVTDSVTGTLSVIDTATGTAVGEPIRIGGGPLGVAISANGARLYVANTTNGTVAVIDASTHAVVGEPVHVGVALYGLIVTPDGKRLYVIDRGIRTDNAYRKGTVLVVDTATNAVVGEPITVGVAPEDLALSPNGDRVYVVNAEESTVSVIDTHTDTVVNGPIVVGRDPAAVALSPDGSLAYITNSGDGGLSVIDTATNTLLGTPLPVARAAPEGGLLYGIAVSPDGNQIYATDHGGDAVTVIAHVPLPGR
jgi:YVTN family beta-propeller protein/VCBS repeat-containing protein